MNEKHALDGVAALAVVGSLAGYIPAIAGLFAIAWYMMQMYDWIKKKQNAKKLKRRKSDTVSA